MRVMCYMVGVVYYVLSVCEVCVCMCGVDIRGSVPCIVLCIVGGMRVLGCACAGADCCTWCGIWCVMCGM